MDIQSTYNGAWPPCPVAAPGALAPGMPAPDFFLPDGKGGAVQLSALRGQPVILFFSPPGWDPDKAEQLRLFNGIVEEVAPHGAKLLGLDLDGMWCDLDFSDREKLHFPLLRDLDPHSTLAHSFGVQGERALFVIDAEGIVRWSQVLPTGAPPCPGDILAALGVPPAQETAASASSASFGLSRRHFVATALAAAFAMAAQPIVGCAQPVSTTSNPSNASANPAGTGATVPLALKVNGTRHNLNLEPRTSLLNALRENIGLTGTKKGCDQGACGACTVLVNGRRINSCLTLAVMHDGDEITTVEGLARGENLHPVQAAFIEHDGFQCGYCTSGQILSAVACIQEGHTGSDAEIREWMSGNICRCGAYPNILAAIKDASRNRLAGNPDALRTGDLA